MLTDISLDKELYNVLASLDGSKLDPAGSYYLRTSLRDYHRAGVDRDDATRDKIRKLQDELVKIGQQFDENIAGDVRKLQVNASDLDGLPDDFKRSHPRRCFRQSHPQHRQHRLFSVHGLCQKRACAESVLRALPATRLPQKH